jgi:hypothetical protein
MSTLNVDRIIDSSGGVFAPVSSVFRSRIINGAMVIDQRNAGAAVNTDNKFAVDRFGQRQVGGGVLSYQQSSTAPSGFVNSLAITVTTADASIAAGDFYQLFQRIEGFNVADLGFGTANAKTVTLSFWVQSSLTGTFGGNIVNSAVNRSYVFQYTISSANTWEYKTITIAGDTTGTWLTDNSNGLTVTWDLGSGTNFEGTANTWAAANYRRASGNVQLVGTNGATWYVTGVQLEVGTQATSFEYRQYQQELALCQRYYYKLQSAALTSAFSLGFCESTTVAGGVMNFPVSLRVSPTALEQQGTAGNYTIRQGGTDIVCSSVPSFVSGTVDTSWYRFTVSSGLTTGQAVMLRASNTSPFLAWSAEL